MSAEDVARLTCPKCRAAMEQGFILDNTYGGRLVSNWAEGKPEKSFWLGISLKDKHPREVTTYRCIACGYLESYAK
jgi:Domain of unknown function (DUF6487)